MANKMFKRAVSMILSILMAAESVPVTSFAEETVPGPPGSRIFLRDSYGSKRNDIFKRPGRTGWDGYPRGNKGKLWD